MSVELARYADDGALVRLESEGQGLSWRFQEQQASCEAQVLGGEEEQGLSEQEKRGQVAGENARVVYEELAAGVDVMYTLEGCGLKEDIILKSEAAAERAVLELSEGYRYRADENGEVSVESQDGEATAFRFSAPYAYDAEGKEIKVRVEIRGTR